jgi:hypothetical protein
VDEADALLGEVFPVAFERRATFDPMSRPGPGSTGSPPASWPRLVRPATSPTRWPSGSTHPPSGPRLEGLSYEDVAAYLDVPVGNIGRGSTGLAADFANWPAPTAKS